MLRARDLLSWMNKPKVRANRKRNGPRARGRRCLLESLEPRVVLSSAGMVLEPPSSEARASLLDSQGNLVVAGKWTNDLSLGTDFAVLRYVPTAIVTLLSAGMAWRPRRLQGDRHRLGSVR